MPAAVTPPLRCGALVMGFVRGLPPAPGVVTAVDADAGHYTVQFDHYQAWLPDHQVFLLAGLEGRPRHAWCHGGTA